MTLRKHLWGIFIAAGMALFLSAPAWGIVITNLPASPGTDPYSALVVYGQPIDGVNLSGVVEVSSSIGGCTGSLLLDGSSILTAGHCVTSMYGAALASNITVTFMAPGGVADSVSVASVSVDPGYTGNSTQGNDLAVLHLSSPAPGFATGYALYNGTPTTALDLLAGYGVSGNGLTGANGTYGNLQAGENQYVVNGSYFGWSSQLLVGEFLRTGSDVYKRPLPEGLGHAVSELR